MEKLLELALQHGIWAGLSVALIFYILKAQEKRDIRQEDREGKYQEIISNLTQKFNVVEEIKQDVEDIKDVIKEKVGVK